LPARAAELVKLNKIYTRTGDDGSTGLVDGSRLSKAEARMAAIGDVDEANCAIGLARLKLDGPVGHALSRIQNDLFDLGADLATPGGPGEAPGSALRVTAGQVAWLEQEIDAINLLLPPLTSFVLPTGVCGAAELHLARAVVRRAERSAVALAETAPVNADALAYLNRLSDLLFVQARHACAGQEVLWTPGASRT
jgi:cob(I)alamin adenosyltransferase